MVVRPAKGKPQPLVWLLLLMTCAWSGCTGGEAPTGPGGQKCDSGAVSYTTVAGVIDAACAGCHSAALAEAARGGAPLGVDFDREEDLYAWRERIRVRALEQADMPPGGGGLEGCGQVYLTRYLDALDTGPCTPVCSGRMCGDDGCGGSCGDCAANELCDPSGMCACEASCVGRQCGDDGCGGSCGDCGAGQTCGNAGLCLCAPDCSGKRCGTDGCGGSCGSCPATLFCNTRAGTCSASCTPDCSGRSCGDDGCGGSCGDCASDQLCTAAGECGCAPQCTGKECGDDGCGGPCGGCLAGQSCAGGFCSWPDVSFAQDVVPLFSSCTGLGCHGAEATKLGLRLDGAANAYASLLNVDASQCTGSTVRVAPGDVAGSYLINKLTGQGMCSGSVMPKTAAKLSESQVDLIRAWIANGAKND